MLGGAGKQEILQQMFQNSRSQIVFRTDIFRKLTLGAPVSLMTRNAKEYRSMTVQ